MSSTVSLCPSLSSYKCSQVNTVGAVCYPFCTCRFQFYPSPSTHDPMRPTVTQPIPLDTNPLDRGVMISPLAPPLTLADVLACIEADPALSPRSRRDMVKALHTFSHVLGVGLAMLP